MMVIAFWVGYGMSAYKSAYKIAWRISNVIRVPISLRFLALSFLYPEMAR